jgi:hypothetical protein
MYDGIGKYVRMAALVKEQMLAGQYATARQTFTDQLSLIDSQIDSVVRSCLQNEMQTCE